MDKTKMRLCLAEFARSSNLILSCWRLTTNLALLFIRVVPASVRAGAHDVQGPAVAVGTPEGTGLAVPRLERVAGAERLHLVRAVRTGDHGVAQLVAREAPGTVPALERGRRTGLGVWKKVNLLRLHRHWASYSITAIERS